MITITPKFLIRKRKRRVAHIWLGADTACRMFSTGGLNRKSTEVFDTNLDLPICNMCQTNISKLQN